MRIMVVDDEQLILQKHERTLAEIDDVEIVAAFDDPLDALEFAKANIGKIDAALLDISMPEMSGLELAEEIGRIDNNVLVAFVTAFDKYAVSAFELNAIDYVLKPVHNDRLRAAVDRLRARMKERAALHVEHPCSKIAINCFSKFTVNDNGKVINWGTKKAEEILAYLLIHRAKSVHRDKLIDVIWQDGDYEKSVVLLQSTIYRLRKTLQLHDNQSHIDSQQSSYQLILSGNVECDLDRYYALLQKIKESLKAGLEVEKRLIDELKHIAKDGFMTDNDWEWKYEYEAVLESEFQRLTGEWLWVEE